MLLAETNNICGDTQDIGSLWYPLLLVCDKTCIWTWLCGIPLLTDIPMELWQSHLEACCLVTVAPWNI